MTTSSSSSPKSGKSPLAGDGEDLAFFMGEKCSVEGAVLEVDGAARIDGQFSGKLRAVHLIVGEKGHVAGDISSETADIMGTVEDTLVLSGKLTIREAGRIEGTIPMARWKPTKAPSWSARSIPRSIPRDRKAPPRFPICVQPSRNQPAIPGPPPSRLTPPQTVVTTAATNRLQAHGPVR